MEQMLWFAVAKEEKGGYGKCMKDLRLRPVVLSAVTYEEKTSRRKWRASHRRRFERVLLQGCYMKRTSKVEHWLRLTYHLSLILSCSTTTIHGNITEYERENNVVLPRRGTVHDLGRSTTQKRSSVKNRSGLKKLRRTSQGKLTTVPAPSIDILAISTVCDSALRKDCLWKRLHS